jgi:hypothetical protein
LGGKKIASKNSALQKGDFNWFDRFGGFGAGSGLCGSLLI